MRFEFATASKIIFGPGTRMVIPELVATLWDNAYVITDSRERVEFLLDGLLVKNISTEVFLVEREPELSTILLATRSYKDSGCNLVIALGGGAVLDTGKAVAALAVNPGDPFDYLEIVGTGLILETPSAPCIAIPTTAGTGSEVTRNAVISIPEKRIKVSLRSPFLLPRVAVVDPELTFSMPPAITASTGLDALTQLIEPFVCNAPSPLTDALCRDGMMRVARSLRQVFTHHQDGAAREDMSLASLYGGMALTNARLGAVHGLAGSIGGMYSAPHGAVCARLLPFVMETNLRAIQIREPESPAITRFAEISCLLTGNPNARLEDGCHWVIKLIEDLNIPPLAMYGLTRSEFSEIAAQAQKSSSMNGNPIVLFEAEVLEILENAL